MAFSYQIAVAEPRIKLSIKQKLTLHHQSIKKIVNPQGGKSYWVAHVA